jgi:hypothetical protein
MDDPQKFNYYEFKHIEGNTTVTYTFSEMYTSKIIDEFISFLRGCGHFEPGIYEHMSSISEEYFEIQEKLNKNLLEKFNLPQPNLCSNLE